MPPIRLVSLVLPAVPVFLGATSPAVAGPGCPEPLVEVTASHLPAGLFNGADMDVRTADLDGDGRLDLVVAVEFGANIVLMGGVDGHFAHAPGALPFVVHDSEDVAVADFDDDGDLDIVFVSEDDEVNEYYLNDGDATFTASALPVTGVSNAVLSAFVNDDALPDLLIGNAGQNVVLINDGRGGFIDETFRLPARADQTQDLELGDIDGDGDLDLVVGNEDDNVLLINDGGGTFNDETLFRLPLVPGAEETREADFGDVDGDGDLDLLFANVEFIPGKDRQNRLLLNDGGGVFTDVTATRLPVDSWHTVDGDFVDLDGDGDLDIVLANAFGGNYRVYTNDGSGTFTDDSGSFLPAGLTGNGIDVEATDLNGDGAIDLFLTSYNLPDHMLFGQPPCAGDVDCSGGVDVQDLVGLITAWGPCTGACPADLDGSGVVDVADLVMLLLGWGDCA